MHQFIQDPLPLDSHTYIDKNYFMDPTTKYKDTALHKAKLAIKPSPIHGYGVFCEQEIKKGEIIEECPVILSKGKAKNLINYAFNWNDKQSALALGYGSIYNHANAPNAEYQKDSKHGLLVIKATEKIHQGQEIFVNYGKNWFNSRDLIPKELLKEIEPNQTTKISKLIFIAFALVLLLPVTTKLNAHFNILSAKFPFHFGRAQATLLHKLNLRH